jgi:hypothetical protein
VPGFRQFTAKNAKNAGKKMPAMLCVQKRNRSAGRYDWFTEWKRVMTVVDLFL